MSNNAITTTVASGTIGGTTGAAVAAGWLDYSAIIVSWSSLTVAPIALIWKIYVDVRDRREARELKEERAKRTRYEKALKEREEILSNRDDLIEKQKKLIRIQSGRLKVLDKRVKDTKEMRT